MVLAWGELTGLLDPMDELDQLIAPPILENSVERIGLMSAEERRGLTTNLVRFLALFYTEILRMLNMAEAGDRASLLQTTWKIKAREQSGDEFGKQSMDEMILMQTQVEKFGILLQKLLGKLERLSATQAAARTAFLMSMLPTTWAPCEQSCPGTHG